MCICCALYHEISIHAPSRERPFILRLLLGSSGFQSTLPRGSDSSDTCKQRSVKIISIHAPSRERLCCIKNDSRKPTISIHAPSRERLSSSMVTSSTLYFNPRSLAGATMIHELQKAQEIISIHAPSRERPCALLLIITHSLHFNPRSLAGATSCYTLFL